MLTIKFNGIYYFRFHGYYWFLRLLYQIMCHALITPEPGVEICIQLSKAGDVTHKKQVFWDNDLQDYTCIISKDYEKETPF